MKPQNISDSISDILRKGVTLRAFSSGGNVRVCRLTDGAGKDCGYAEGAVASECLANVIKSYKKGGKNVGDVYFTGQAATEDELDAWLCQGSKFFASFVGNQFVVVLKGFAEYKTPEDIHARAQAGERNLRHTSSRGVVYETNPTRFADNSMGSSTSIVTLPEGMVHNRAWMWRMSKTGLGSSFAEALKAAWTADETEEPDT